MKHVYIGIMAMLLWACHDASNDSRPIEFTQVWKRSYDRTVTFSSIPGHIEGDQAWIQIDSFFLIVRTSTGELIRSVSSGQQYALAGSRNMIYDEGKLYVHIPQWIRCYDFESGDVIWHTPLENELEAMILTEMSFSGDRLIVAKRGGAYTVNKNSGQIEDVIDLQSTLNLTSDPRDILVRDVVAGDERTLFFATELQDVDKPEGGGFVVSIDTESKASNWIIHSALDTSNGVAHKPGISKMDLYGERLIFLRGGHVHAVDRSDGRELWFRRFDQLGFFFGLEISDDGVIYLGSTGWDRLVIALNASSGREMWRNNLGLASIQYLKVKNDLLFVLAEHLVVLDRHDGQTLLDFVGDTGDFFFGPPTIGTDAFIGISSQRVYGWTYR